MADSRAQEIMRRQGALAAERGVLENKWRKVARLVLPAHDDFNSKRTPNEIDTNDIYDDTAPLANDRFGAANDSMNTPRAQEWHELAPADADLVEDRDVKLYLDQVTKLLFRMRYRPIANFAGEMQSVYLSMGAFGTGPMFIENAPGIGPRYQSLHLGEVYLAENSAGLIDTVHRKFELTARQAVQKWGDSLPSTIRGVVDKEPDRKFEFVHAVQPREEYSPNGRAYERMPFASCYVSVEGSQVVDEGGYNTMPYAVGRWAKLPRSAYGYGPGVMMLADIQMLNQMAKVIMKASHRNADPPLLLSDDQALKAFHTRPGALNRGAVMDGRPQVFTLPGGNIQFTLEHMNQIREAINAAFLVTLFQILVDSPQMTATEAMYRQQEKGALLAPSMGRFQSEFLGVVIEREIDILAAAGVLPPMPRKLLERGGEIKIEYSSPLTRAQRSAEGAAILRWLESLIPLAQVKPELLDMPDMDAAARVLADVWGVPAKLVRAPEMLEALRDQRAQQQAAQALLAAAPVAGQTVERFAKAGQLATQAPF